MGKKIDWNKECTKYWKEHKEECSLHCSRNADEGPTNCKLLIAARKEQNAKSK